MQLPITGAVTLAAIVMQSLKQRRKLVEEFKARHVRLFDLVSLFRSHADDYL